MPSYFVTAGRGTTYFVCKELREFDPYSKISTTDGKVFFTSDVSPSKWLDLKSVERLFVQVYYNNGYRIDHDNDGGGGISVLQETVEGISTEIWSNALRLWKEIRSRLCPISDNEQIMKRTCCQEGSNGLTMLPNKKAKLSSGDGCDHSSHLVQANISNPVTAFQQTLRTVQEGCESDVSSCVQICDHGELTISAKSSITVNSKEIGNLGKSSSTVDSRELCHVTASAESSFTVNSNETVNSAKSSRETCYVTDSEETAVTVNLKALSSLTESSPTASVTKSCNVTDVTESGSVTFRVSSKISGYARQFGKKAVLDALVRSIESKGWKSTTHQPLVEVYSQLNNEHLVIGIPCTREPLSKRLYLKTIGLRSTVCWAMASLADTKETDIVLDPMCGAATVLIEAVKSFNVQRTIGCDVSACQLSLASASVNWADTGRSCTLLRADVRALPLPACCVDVVLCDTPFGNKHGLNCRQVGDMYPGMLSEMSRVLKPGGRLVLLTSAAMVMQLVKAVLDMCTIGGDTVNEKCPTGGDTVHEKCLTDEDTVHAKCPIDGDTVYEKCPIDGDTVHENLLAESNTARERTTGCDVCNHSCGNTCISLADGSEDTVCEQNNVCNDDASEEDTSRLNEEHSLLHNVDLSEMKTSVNVTQPNGVQIVSTQTKKECDTFTEIMLKIKQEQMFDYKDDSNSPFRGALVLKRSHFLKLGETMAYALLFHKR